MIKFIVINSIIKGIPLWIIRKSKITQMDILFSIFVFFCYLLWLYINNIRMSHIYTMVYFHYVNGDEKQLITGKIYDEIYLFFKHLLI